VSQPLFRAKRARKVGRSAVTGLMFFRSFA
jgi:hypothetical protein